MKTDDNLFIHVGLPRTGTTFLQKNVFPKMDVSVFSRYEKFPLMAPRNFVLNAKINDNQINLLSDENLFGRVFLDKKQDSGIKIANRLKKIWPNAKIIVTFREKESWVRSLYKLFIRFPERSKLVNNFDEWYNDYFNKKCLDFDTYEAHLKNLFEDVLVLKFEELKKNDKSYIRKIADFMDVPMPTYIDKTVNFSIPNDRCYRFLNKLAGTPMYNYVRPALTDYFIKINEEKR